MPKHMMSALPETDVTVIPVGDEAKSAKLRRQLGQSPTPQDQATPEDPVAPEDPATPEDQV